MQGKIDKLPNHLQAKWQLWVSHLGQNVFVLPRSYEVDGNAQTRNLLGFCDASDNAYAAVVYL